MKISVYLKTDKLNREVVVSQRNLILTERTEILFHQRVYSEQLLQVGFYLIIHNGFPESGKILSRLNMLIF